MNNGKYFAGMLHVKLDKSTLFVTIIERVTTQYVYLSKRTYFYIYEKENWYLNRLDSQKKKKLGTEYNNEFVDLINYPRALEMTFCGNLKQVDNYIKSRIEDFKIDNLLLSLKHEFMKAFSG